MGYSNVAYLESIIDPEVLANIADHVNNPGNIADPVTIANIDAAIATADEMIDSYIRTVYSGTLPVPASSVPGVIQSCSGYLAICELWQSKSNLPDVWEAHCKKWMKWLKDLGAGRVTIDLPGEAAVGVHGLGFNKNYSDRQFSPEEIAGGGF